MTTMHLPVRAPGELILLHRRALRATGGVVDRAVLYAADDPEVGRLIRSATLANLWTAEYLGRWSLPAAAGEAGADAYHRSVDLVDEAACRPGALRANAPLSDGSVGDGAALLVERIVALDRVGRALATAASVHRTVDAELDLLVAQVVARSGARPELVAA
jgi:hypothetical protein